MAMLSLSTWYLALVAGGVVLALAALRWTGNRRARVLICALFLALLPVAFVAHADLLGRPRPLALRWLQAQRPGQVPVLGADVVEGRSICLMVKLPGEAEPRLFRLDWDRKLAEQVQAALREAQNNGTGMMMD